jgi:phage gpG-like protein
MATLPRVPSSSTPINPVDIATAISSLRFDRIVSIKFELRPTMGLVAKDVERLGLDIRSFREPLSRSVRRVIIPSIRKNFQVGGRPAWDSLAEGTIKHRNYSAWPILEVTGKLKRRATQFNIWDIGLTTAVVRRLPQDAFYGVFHQAGSEGRRAGVGHTIADLLLHRPGSHGAAQVLAPFISRARKELGTKAGESHVYNRAIGMMIDAEGGWRLPSRPFIMYQSEDVAKIEAVFLEWMTERAIRSGRFVSSL